MLNGFNIIFILILDLIKKFINIPKKKNKSIIKIY